MQDILTCLTITRRVNFQPAIAAGDIHQAA
jgi:hypothetical protein